MAKTKKKKKTFNAGTAIRALAREHIGQPKSTEVLGDKRNSKRNHQIARELRHYRSY